MSQPLLSLQHIGHAFDDQVVLQDINLTLHEGEILFLLGASGSGKTTLLRIIAGFERADVGRMTIRDQLIFDDEHFMPPRLRQLGYVLQEGVLFPHMNVYRNIAYGLGDGKGKDPADRHRIAEVMELTGITNLADRMPHQISGGQQQRVALARALAPKPKIMLLDEPFSALDEHLRAQIRNDVIDILRRSESAAIIVTHDRHEALSCADKIALLQNSYLAQFDSPANIYENPCNVEVASFICDQSLLIPARLNADGCTANCHLGSAIPTRLLCAPEPSTTKVQAPQSEAQGQLLIRSDQLVPILESGIEGDFTAQVERITFQGESCQVQLNTGNMQFLSNIQHAHRVLNVGDTIPLKIVGSALFYTSA
ncbi:ABC transporter ATP-binding protein [Brackiella oedipodis]|uniref:ABC transporter ATP-binding protein n=1 Tax=Brackiella oedipodis TaxID=124225 RepID=UPI00068670A9|nr:ABC transporter ATP-binding protein [Brackiella oedipodis]